MKKIIEQQIEFLKKCLEDTADGSWSTHLNKPIQKQIENLTEQLRLYDVSNSFNLEIKDRDIATIEVMHDTLLDEKICSWCSYRFDYWRRVIQEKLKEEKAKKSK